VFPPQTGIAREGWIVRVPLYIVPHPVETWLVWKSYDTAVTVSSLYPALLWDQSPTTVGRRVCHAIELYTLYKNIT